MMVFGFLTRRARKRAVSPRPLRLNLETLEARDVPSTLTATVHYNGGTFITLYGHLSDTSTPSGQVVTVWGRAQGQATTDANGNFFLSVVASGLGDVLAKTPDSNIVDTVLTDTAPQIDSFKAIEGPNHMWTFTGHVVDPSPQDLVIYLGGQPVSLSGKTINNVDSNGNFSIAIQLNGTTTDNGMAMAQAVDAWGLTSNFAMASVCQMGT
jgi:hypothetical protein